MSDQSGNSNSNARGYRPSNSVPRIGRIGQWGDAASRPSNSRSSNSAGPRVATFRDIGSASSRGGHVPEISDDDDEDESGGEGQNFFTGGERSGLAVQNPDHRQSIPGGNTVRDLLRKAAEAGPPPIVPDNLEPRSAFSGSGNTLGSDVVESQVVPDPTALPAQPAAAEGVIRLLTLWRDGFNIENGPLLHYDDPHNAELLRLINQGQAPPEVFNVHYGQPVELRIDRRINETYEEPPGRPVNTFGGSGFRLGAPVDPIISSVGSVSTSSALGSRVAPGSQVSDPESVQTKFEVDQTQPTTSVQLRLADGTRMVCRMNLTHTVGDIRNFINASRPENLTRSYTIATTFPNRVLDEDTKTIEAAGLKNSVVVQRWDASD
ncbi:hypothetical protein EW145_g1665 [Phellinidium pouzarii]|uniref:UBX domain-containing protein n=1 Tax=Phellinidium pouzarii TaxID=167371 RepID=A0A4S4LDN4_9AGAM|nr:hypothetical protein EW145_g1665 [Phellinidium pouzarii]